MKVRGNRTQKPTAKNIALDLGSNAEKWSFWKKERNDRLKGIQDRAPAAHSAAFRLLIATERPGSTE